MAAPKGNQYALGNEGGRPRIHDREDIARQLIEWARDENSMNLNKFCCTREPPLDPNQILTWSHEDKEFRRAYDIAKGFLAARREERLNNELLHVKAYDLNATVYDQFIKKDKLDMITASARAAKDAQEDTDSKYLDGLNKIMSQLSSGMDNNCKSDSSNVQIDNKS